MNPMTLHIFVISSFSTIHVDGVRAFDIKTAAHDYSICNTCDLLVLVNR